MELVKEANAKAKEKIGLTKPVPLNMFEFDTFWSSLRAEPEATRLDYIKSIPVATFKKIFKAAEINP